MSAKLAIRETETKDKKTEGDSAVTEMTPMQCIDSFIRNVKLLTLDMKKRFPKDAMVDRIEKRINLAASIDPLFVMKTVGDYIVAYEGQISDRDEKFFLEKSFDEEIDEGTKQDKIDMVKYLMPKIKEKFKSLDKGDRESYFDTISEMLEAYVTYKILDDGA